MIPKHCDSKKQRPGSSAGFTLIELLVALVVISVAISAFMLCFDNARVLEAASRRQELAAAFAEDKLSEVQVNPGLYDWSLLASAEPGAIVRVPKQGMDLEKGPFVYPCGTPATKALGQRAASATGTQHASLRYQVYAKKPTAEQAYVEVTVVVRWIVDRRGRFMALTSSLPKTDVEGIA